ncbi:hypothetical protein B0T16DRAFT_453481 [Cercophora newfieldiana]|uniref:Uncharacterized protein n=1 Tax=Cercophora newfieldiana TaxID=92897 RepID=A0AA39YUZ1_9PEZI|nr:hypothetical protein B0T16DRAFT_453481 [Cercophora newfieldiana]
MHLTRATLAIALAAATASALPVTEKPPPQQQEYTGGRGGAPEGAPQNRACRFCSGASAGSPKETRYHFIIGPDDDEDEKMQMNPGSIMGQGQGQGQAEKTPRSHFYFAEGKPSTPGNPMGTGGLLEKGKPGTPSHGGDYFFEKTPRNFANGKPNSPDNTPQNMWTGNPETYHPGNPFNARGETPGAPTWKPTTNGDWEEEHDPDMMGMPMVRRSTGGPGLKTNPDWENSGRKDGYDAPVAHYSGRKDGYDAPVALYGGRKDGYDAPVTRTVGRHGDGYTTDFVRGDDSPALSARQDRADGNWKMTAPGSVPVPAPESEFYPIPPWVNPPSLPSVHYPPPMTGDDEKMPGTGNPRVGDKWTTSAGTPEKPVPEPELYPIPPFGSPVDTKWEGHGVAPPPEVQARGYPVPPSGWKSGMDVEIEHPEGPGSALFEKTPFDFGGEDRDCPGCSSA